MSANLYYIPRKMLPLIGMDLASLYHGINTYTSLAYISEFILLSYEETALLKYFMNIFRCFNIVLRISNPKLFHHMSFLSIIRDISFEFLF